MNTIVSQEVLCQDIPNAARAQPTQEPRGRTIGNIVHLKVIVDFSQFTVPHGLMIHGLAANKPQLDLSGQS